MKKISAKILSLIVLLIIVACSQQKTSGVESIGITVADMDVSLPFYRDVLHF